MAHTLDAPLGDDDGYREKSSFPQAALGVQEILENDPVSFELYRIVYSLGLREFESLIHFGRRAIERVHNGESPINLCTEFDTLLDPVLAKFTAPQHQIGALLLQACFARSIGHMHAYEERISSAIEYSDQISYEGVRCEIEGVVFKKQS